VRVAATLIFVCHRLILFKVEGIIQVMTDSCVGTHVSEIKYDQRRIQDFGHTDSNRILVFEFKFISK
jgi:hypothetical protein